MNTSVIIIGILAVAGVVVLAFLFANASRQRRSAENVPPAMRPGYSDEQLERSVIERYMAWGVILTLFFAVFFPIYWFAERSRLTTNIETRFVEQTIAGEALYQQNCSECHGGDATGGGAESPYDPESGWPAPNLANIVARYEENRNIVDIQNFIETTIAQGRPGTPMPAWGGESGGPLTDEQIESITLWLLANQVPETEEAAAAMDVSGEELYLDNCLRCHGPDLLGEDGEEGRPGRNLVGVFQRHSEESILGILRNGIYVPTGTVMPPWQDSYQHQPYTDEALQRIVDYLRERQPPDALPDASDDETEGDETEGDEESEPEAEETETESEADV